MERKFRLTRSTDFQRVRRDGKSYAHPLMVLLVIPSQQPGQGVGVRCGVTAGRSVGGAVQRNRAKRLLRSAMRPLLPRLAPAWDVVLIARRPILQADFAQVQAALLALVGRANILGGGA